jgi:DNA-binding response OmpR family regulator
VAVALMNHREEGKKRMMSTKSRVLIIEDDRRMSDALVSGIKTAAYEVLAASSAEEGFFLVQSLHPDLLLLDLTLPHRNGLETLAQIRREGIDLRVLILISHNTVDERVEGLRTGADDYLGKPFSFPELLARMDALLRRVLPPPTPAPLSAGDLVLDPKIRSTPRETSRLELMAREFDLLLYLVENHGRTVSREMLANDVWHHPSGFTPINKVIDVRVARLQRKVDNPFAVELLQTVRGLDFSLPEPQP